ncbi:MAG TPA: nucleoside-diphosphate kinase [Prolixibacteraceae bacterium]|nr:nucleoside-diphosphate kinase [Prolixibacteraceae bacterium]
MTGQQTLTMIKPDAVRNNDTGAILKVITDAGFRIKAIKLIHLTQKQAGQFYAVHADKSFFEDLTSFMSSGPLMAAILEKENAVAAFRELIGSTDPRDAAEGTIRKLFAESKSRNAIHGSDSEENAVTECDFFFSKTERVD